MISTQDLKVRLESTLASLESDLKHVDNEIHGLNQKIDERQQVRSGEWVVGYSRVVGVHGWVATEFEKKKGYF